MTNQLCKDAVDALLARGFEAVYVATGAEAKALIMQETESVQSVGWGGSETLKEIGVRDALRTSGKEIRDHQIIVDLFLLSANALTRDGRIVNIDGTGNRVAASICGPKRVIYVIGCNKIVEGGVDAAIARVKRCACPPNARRLGRKTPCAEAGVCTNCDSPDRMCKVTAIFDRCPTGMPTRVIVVGESLGY